MILRDLLLPVTSEEFIERYLGRSYLVVHGERGRFRHIITWRTLNEALARLRPTADRLMLIKQGRPVPRASYIYTSPNDRVSYLRGPAFLSRLKEGATLVVNQVDELFPVVRELAESCEDLFRVHVHANLYAGWRLDNGFDLHWDKHDTLIVQIIGRKRWTVWAPTQLHPLPDVSGEVAKPTGAPAWDGLLEEGQVLYMPRGWWHIARPTDEPCLHVTLGIRHPTGIDMINWLVGRLGRHLEFRQDVPHLKSRGEQDAWLDSIRPVLSEMLAEAAIDQFMDNVSNHPETRSIVSVPELSVSSMPDVANEAALRLSSWKPLVIAEAEGSLSVTTERGVWRCPLALKPALELLHPSRPVTLAQMIRMVPDSSRLHLRSFLQGLIAANTVWAEPVTFEMDKVTG